MEQAEDVASLAPAPVFVDDTGRRRKLTRRVGRILLVGFTAYIGLVMMGFARDPRLGPLHLPAIGLGDLGLIIPPAPVVLGEQTTGSTAAAEIEVSTTGATAGDVGPGPSSSARPAANNSRGTGASGRGTSPSGLDPAPGSPPTMPPAGSGTTTTSTSATTTTASRGNSPKATTTTTATTASSTPTTTTPTTPGQGPVSAKGPDGSGPPGQQRKTTSTTGG